MGHVLKGKSVLVTGGAGCIGAWVVKGLRDIGARPIVYDMSGNRRRLDLIMERAKDVDWIKGDITSIKSLNTAIVDFDIFAIIHLAALQVPFAKADPVLGTQVNVMGTTHVFEASREAGIKRIAYASSIAAPAMGENNYLDTLYGAHKVCNEQMAKVYWQDWEVPSICIRPGVIYGPGRDQGMRAAPTLGLLAALSGQPYDIPFTGPVSYVYAEDAAQRFIAAIARETEGAPVYDMNGVVVDMDEILQAIEYVTPYNGVTSSGKALPFPALVDDGKLDAFIGVAPHRDFQTGLDDAAQIYRLALKNGVIDLAAIKNLIGIKE